MAVCLNRNVKLSLLNSERTAFLNILRLEDYNFVTCYYTDYWKEKMRKLKEEYDTRDHLN